jgi:hypothetical protein
MALSRLGLAVVGGGGGRESSSILFGKSRAIKQAIGFPRIGGGFAYAFSLNHGAEISYEA